jgi:hypothetical protein
MTVPEKATARVEQHAALVADAAHHVERVAVTAAEQDEEQEGEDEAGADRAVAGVAADREGDEHGGDEDQAEREMAVCGRKEGLHVDTSSRSGWNSCSTVVSKKRARSMASGSDGR